MRRVFAIAVIAGFCLVAVLLYNDIKSFIWTHPWWHSFLVAIPGIAAPVLAGFELQHSKEANNLRTEANNHRTRANALQAELNQHLQQIAANTQRPLSEAEINARILKKYVGQRALVTEGGNHWGAAGAIVAEVNDSNIFTLFVPAGYNSSQAWGQPVRCDKVHVVEVSKDGCAVQLSIIERYGNATSYGEARSWDERHLQPTRTGIQRGTNVFSAQYRKDGSPKLQHIHIYSSTNDNSNYLLVTGEDQKEMNSWYNSKLDIEKKFAIIQAEWVADGYRYDGGGGNGTLNLFVRK